MFFALFLVKQEDNKNDEDHTLVLQKSWQTLKVAK